MKLTEITKKEFIQGLKDPGKQKVKQKIKELRRLLKPLEWKVRSSYNPKARVVSLSMYTESESIVTYDLKTSKVVTNIAEVKDAVESKFSENRNYVLYMGWQSSNDDYLVAEVVIG